MENLIRNVKDRHSWDFIIEIQKKLEIELGKKIYIRRILDYADKYGNIDRFHYSFDFYTID